MTARMIPNFDPAAEAQSNDLSERYPGGAAGAWGLAPLNWGEFWSAEPPSEDWDMEPILPAGRQTSVFASAKVGKSLLALDGAAAKATGRSVFGQPAEEAARVVYVDLEMTEVDLRERLTDMGYSRDDDLSKLAYYSLPSLPPLDTELGGDILLDLAEGFGAKFCVIDTMARAVSGDENLADTYRAFYRHTGARLKAAGIGLLRLDHEGQDAARGPRGSSAKDDDPDLVFRLSTVDVTTLKLTRTRSRVPWVPAEVTLRRHEEPVRHVIVNGGSPAGTHAVVKVLDELKVPLDATADTALRALKAAGQGRRKALVLAALKARRERP